MTVNPLLNFELYIFDLDGTLVDSLSQIENSLNFSREQHSLPQAPRGLVFQNLGLPIKHFFSDLDINREQEESLIKVFRTHLSKAILKENLLFPSTILLLRFLKKHNRKIAVATGKSSEMAKSVVKNSRLHGNIDFIQGTDGFPAKPNPEVLFRCLNHFSLRNAVMIGDRVEDILAAKNAAIPAIGIAQSAHNKHDLLSAGAIKGYPTIAAFFHNLSGV